MGPLLNCHSWISISIPPHKDAVLADLMTTVQYYSPSGEKETGRQELYEDVHLKGWKPFDLRKKETETEKWFMNNRLCRENRNI